MKKILLVVLTLILSTNYLFAQNRSKEVRISNEAIKIIRKLKSSDFHKVIDKNDNPVYLLKNTNNAKKFMKLNLDYEVYNESEMKKHNEIDASDSTEFVQISSYDSDVMGICRSFVQALISDKNWLKSKYTSKVSKNIYIQKGRVLISLGKGKGHSGHIVVYMGRDSTGIWVLDQNYYYSTLNEDYETSVVIGGAEVNSTTGVVSIHKILFKEKDFKSVSNAYTYMTLEKK